MEGKNTDMNSSYTDLILTNPSRCLHQTDYSIPYLYITQSFTTRLAEFIYHDSGTSLAMFTCLSSDIVGMGIQKIGRYV